MDMHSMRGSERILIVIGGILLILLGAWRLQKVRLPQTSGAKFKTELFEMSFTKLGPGVLLAALGAWVLYTAMTTQITDTDLTVTLGPITVHKHHGGHSH